MADLLLLHEPDRLDPKKGLVCGYIDDLYWAATFFKMVKVIEFVAQRGPAFGCTLNMKKCVYLMAPTAKALTDDELGQRLAVLTALGLPLEDIKIHPDCQPESPPDVAAKRRVEWGFKILGAFVGADEYDLAKHFPNWIALGREGDFLRTSEDQSPSLAAQVLNSINQRRTLVPEGFFRAGDDLSAIMKTIESIDERRSASRRPSQLRREPVALAWKKTSQAALCAQLVGAEFND